jgi:hypothetical protein
VTLFNGRTGVSVVTSLGGLAAISALLKAFRLPGWSSLRWCGLRQRH